MRKEIYGIEVREAGKKHYVVNFLGGAPGLLFQR
jgi:hypothetical protein